jgi:hypothetical protein
MAELTQPFLLAGKRLSNGDSIPDWLRAEHIQTRWLDECILLSESSEFLCSELPGLPPSSLTYRWPGWKQSQQYFLHQACREISTGEQRMILLVNESSTFSEAMVISSPAAIGMYNQIPLAYLEIPFAQHLDQTNLYILPLIESILLKAEKKPQDLNTLLIQPGKMKKPVKKDTSFESASWTKPKDAPFSTITACLDVVDSLAVLKKKNGLVVEVDAAENLYGLWIERL